MVSLLVDFVLIMSVTLMVVTLMVVTLMLLGISPMFRLMTVSMMAIVFFFPADDFADNLAGCSC